MKEETLRDIGEFECIHRIAHDFIYRPELVKLGAGDDGAVFMTPCGYDEVISTDTMVEGIHFTKRTMSAADTGYHLCAVNFSDMAAMGAERMHTEKGNLYKVVAMGAEPVSFVISAALPGDLSITWIESCYDGIRECCREYSVNLLGGDITGSKQGIILTGTIVGIVPENQAVKRSGAKEGDIVFVTGTLGDSSAGLSILLDGKKEEYPMLAIRHQRPKPQIDFGRILRESGASSLNDVSDGLSREINEIASASRVTIELEKERIPLSDELCRWGQDCEKEPFCFAINGGEDYELVGTISKKNWEYVKGIGGVTGIGHVKKAGKGRVFLKDKNSIKLLTIAGYDHFRS